jgi:hypothetical protein
MTNKVQTRLRGYLFKTCRPIHQNRARSGENPQHDKQDTNTSAGVPVQDMPPDPSSDQGAIGGEPAA